MATLVELMKRGYLTLLSLRSNKIGDDGAQLLADGLKGSHSQGSPHCQVNVLDLHMNGHGSEGVGSNHGGRFVSSQPSLPHPRSPITLLQVWSIPGIHVWSFRQNLSWSGICYSSMKMIASAQHERRFGGYGFIRTISGGSGVASLKVRSLCLCPKSSPSSTDLFPLQREGGVERRYRPSLSTLWNVVRALPIESIFGQRLSGEKEVAGPGGEVGGSGEGVGGSREAFASSCVTC